MYSITDSSLSSFSIILAPAGSNLREAQKKLNRILPDCKICDIEEELCKLPRTKESLENFGSSFIDYPPNMYDVTWSLPREKVGELWKEAVDKCLQDLKRCKKRVKILSGHQVYYCGRRDEFYSVFDSNVLTEKSAGWRLSPSHILLLIDDVYDMYSRLTQNKQLFDPVGRIKTWFGRICEEENIEITDLQKLDYDLTLLSSTWKLGVMQHILSWRHLEIIQAENLALQFNARFLLFAVKQRLDAVKQWLTGIDDVSLYISHPITELRRQRRSEDKWPTFVSQLNKLQEIFLKYNITPIMPTGIDELRLEKEKPSGYSLHRYTGYSEPRWPLISPEKMLLYVKPDNAIDIDYPKFFSPEYWNFNDKKFLDGVKLTENLKENSSNLLRTFIHQIETQISSRDHLLVFHTDGILVFRPLFGGTSHFHRGVMEEINHWRILLQSGVHKKAAFVHFEEDIKGCLDLIRDSNQLMEPLKFVLIQSICKKHGLNQDETLSVINDETESILGKGKVNPVIAEKIRKELPQLKKEAKIRLLQKHLTSVESDKKTENFISIWIFKNFEEFVNECQKIGDFFRTSHPRGNDWRDNIDVFIPENIT